MSTEHRHFTGVAGNTEHRGELFGITNMFRFTADHNTGFAKHVFSKSMQMQDGVATARFEPIVSGKEKVFIVNIFVSKEF